MALIWRNELQRGDAANPGITLEHPRGDITITNVVEVNGNYHIWFAPVPAVPATTDEDRIRDAMTEARDHPGRIITR